MSVAERDKLLREAVEEANLQIYELSQSRDHLSGMGTTVVAILATEASLTVAHIGDSRAYLCREGEIIRLTEDHSLVYELMKSGQLTREEAERHPRRNVLTRALGTETKVEADIREHVWQHGDIVLICSDGLNGMVPDARLCDILQAEEDLEQKADFLVHTALEAGGDDNVTVVLLENVPGDTDAKG
jgi:serine/threonine protein phosphatase PrpC